MTVPYRLGAALEPEVWQKVKTRAIFECCKWDIQSEDHCVLADFPLLLEESEWQRICGLAKTLSHETGIAEKELIQRPDLYRLLGLPWAVRKQLCKRGAPSAEVARVMRFDFHFTKEGWKISEVNSDVPGGFVEASGFTHLMAEHYSDVSVPADPAHAYAEAVVEQFGTNAVIAMVHATAYSDDRQVMQFLAQRIAGLGPRVIMASPDHIVWEQGRASVSSKFANSPLDLLIRFSPAEWLTLLGGPQKTFYFKQSRTPISNPAAAILTQSKRFPLAWPKLLVNLPAWSSLLPETHSPSDISPREFHDWVLKPVLGRVGEDVGLAGTIPDRRLSRIHKAAGWHSWEWVAQRRFEVVPVYADQGTYYPCIGVFTINGRVAGAYGRISTIPLIDDRARDVAVLISRSGGGA